MVHIILLIVVLTAVFVRNQKLYLQAIPFLMLFLFAALRYEYGNDYLSYYGMYLYYHSKENPSFGEEGLFELMCWISPSFYLLIAVTSAIFIYVVYRLAIDIVPSKWICISVFIFVVSPYLFLMNLSAIRQCLAMACFIIAVQFAVKRRPLPYVLLILLASLLHKSALILLPAYFVASTRKVKTHTVVVITFLVLASVFFLDLSEAAVYVAEMFEDSSYVHYATNEMRNSLRATLLTGLYFVYVAGNITKLEGKAIAYAKLYLVGLIFGIFAIDLSMFTRAQMYFDVFAVVTLPLIWINVQSRGPVLYRSGGSLAVIWDCVNKYILPILIICVYCLRYYSFFANPMWVSFSEYATILTVL